MSLGREPRAGRLGEARSRGRGSTWSPGRCSRCSSRSRCSRWRGRSTRSVSARPTSAQQVAVLAKGQAAAEQLDASTSDATRERLLRIEAGLIGAALVVTDNDGVVAAFDGGHVVGAASAVAVASDDGRGRQRRAAQDRRRGPGRHGGHSHRRHSPARRDPGTRRDPPRADRAARHRGARAARRRGRRLPRRRACSHAG